MVSLHIKRIGTKTEIDTMKWHIAVLSWNGVPGGIWENLRLRTRKALARVKWSLMGHPRRTRKGSSVEVQCGQCRTGSRDFRGEEC